MQLKALGLRLSTDDFGTGLSNLEALQKIDFDRIKIDRQFVHEVADNEHTAELLRLIQGIAQLFRRELIC